MQEVELSIHLVQFLGIGGVQFVNVFFFIELLR